MLELKLKLEDNLMTLQKSHEDVSITLGEIAYLIQDARLEREKNYKNLEIFYGHLIMDYLEHSKIETLSLGTAFFVISKCRSDEIAERFLKYLLRNCGEITDFHAIGNAATVLDNLAYSSNRKIKELLMEVRKLITNSNQQSWKELYLHL